MELRSTVWTQRTYTLVVGRRHLPGIQRIWISTVSTTYTLEHPSSGTAYHPGSWRDLNDWQTECFPSWRRSVRPFSGIRCVSSPPTCSASTPSPITRWSNMRGRLWSRFLVDITQVLIQVSFSFSCDKKNKSDLLDLMIGLQDIKIPNCREGIKTAVNVFFWLTKFKCFFFVVISFLHIFLQFKILIFIYNKHAFFIFLYNKHAFFRV